MACADMSYSICWNTLQTADVVFHELFPSTAPGEALASGIKTVAIPW